MIREILLASLSALSLYSLFASIDHPSRPGASPTDHPWLEEPSYFFLRSRGLSRNRVVVDLGCSRQRSLAYNSRV